MFDSLFTNIGAKLKDFAKTYFAITSTLLTVGGLIGLLGTLDNELIMETMAWVVLIPLFGVPLLIAINLLFCWLLAAVGEIAEAASRTVPQTPFVPVQQTPPAPAQCTPPAPQPVVQPQQSSVPAEKREYDFEDDLNPLAEDAQFVDVLCPKCHETLSFVVGTKKGMCPDCGTQFDLV